MRSPRFFRRFAMALLTCLLPAAVFVSASSHLAGQTKAPAEENRWEPNIRRFEQADRKEFPPKNEILFVGSSSIVGWDLAKCFPDMPTINRGFGGSQIADSTHFAERIILPYKPRIIALYAGDNDINAGKSPEQVRDDYRKFVAKVHHALPETRIVFIAIKPSIKRWKMIDTMREANRMIREITEKHDRLDFVDVDRPMIGDDGKPAVKLFKQDGLHLNAEGYELWSKLVRPHLARAQSDGRPL